MEHCAVHRYFSLPANGLEEPAPQELQDRISLAFADNQVRALAQKTAFRIVELARKAALDHAMQNAIEASNPADGNAGVLAALETSFGHVSAELAEWNDAARIAEQRARQRAAQTNHLVVRAMNLAAKKRSELAWIERQIASAKYHYSEQAKRFSNAGLTTEQIELLGGYPPPVDTEKLSLQWKIHDSDIRAMDDFCSDPLRRTSKLGDIDLQASDAEDMQRVEKLATETARGKLAVAAAAAAKKLTKKQVEASRIAEEKTAKDRIIVDRAIVLAATKQRELDELHTKIMSAQSRPSTNPELMGWRQQVDTLQKDIAALNDFCGDYPHFRIEKAKGLLGDEI